MWSLPTFVLGLKVRCHISIDYDYSSCLAIVFETSEQLHKYSGPKTTTIAPSLTMNITTTEGKFCSEMNLLME